MPRLIIHGHVFHQILANTVGYRLLKTLLDCTPSQLNYDFATDCSLIAGLLDR